MENNPTKPWPLRSKKLWKVAQRRTNQVEQQRTNVTVEVKFGQILSKAKQLSANNTQPIFERDYRNDSTDSATFMHAYITSNFYFLLECDHFYNYRIEYGFYNCPFESVIRLIMVGYPFDERAQEVTPRPDFSTHYRNVLAYQDKKYITQQR